VTTKIAWKMAVTMLRVCVYTDGSEGNPAWRTSYFSLASSKIS